MTAFSGGKVAAVAVAAARAAAMVRAGGKRTSSLGHRAHSRPA